MAPQLSKHDSPPNSPAPRVRRRWYGYQVLGADAAWIVTAVASERAEFLFLYPVAGPVVHALHERPGAALGSLGLRVGLPLLFAGLSLATRGDCRHESSSGASETSLGCSLAPIGLGVVGAGLAVLGDAVALSWEPIEMPKAAMIPTPRVMVGSEFTGVRLDGRF